MTQLIFKMKKLGLFGLSFLIVGNLLVTPMVYVSAEDGNSSSGSNEQSEEQKKAQEALLEKAKKQREIKIKAAEELREKAKTERSTSRENYKKLLEEAKTAKEDKKLEKSRELAKELAEGRLEVLKKLQSGEHTKNCRAAAKAEAVTAINAVITRLEKDQAEAITLQTVDSIRTKISDDIIGKNHVYIAVLPAVRGMCISDKIVGLVEGKLATIVTRLKADGLDTTKLEALLADTKAKAQSAYAAYKKIANNPGATTYKADLAAAKTTLKAAKSSLSAARDEIDLLKETVSDDSTSSDSP
ncbi:MAG: hypothetical protein NUV80_02075 [Candidatus Berkelbacteria bacterium]|nr:hypothetical protein [Candidatus Berkelbacteria bacterium]MCR4307322.1 hypothetical protein [Candidatus Berkelbacteria bacterium]